MSLTGAMMTGVAGLDAYSNALSVSSANIANVNTVGYKAATNNFETLVAAAAGTSNPSSGSVVAISGQNVTQQGLMTTTSSSTDLAIEGNGFFAVSPSSSDTSSLEYTRAGSFSADSNGNLVNSAGLYLMGWKLDSSGNPPTNPADMSLINVSDLSGKAEASTSIGIQANLQASAAEDSSYVAGDMTAGNVTPDFQRTINVYDSQGGTQPLEFSFVKTGANQWNYEVTYQGNSSNITGSNPIAEGTMTFNADGSLANVVPKGGSGSPATGTVSISIPWSASSGLSTTGQTLSINMGTVGSTDGVTQFDTTSTLTNATVDGAVFGNVTGVSVASDGTVSANFSNGLSQAVFKIPLVTFTNPDGLDEVSGNAYTATPTSGTAVVNTATTDGAGSISSKSLESSTVDLATEFTNMITTQRAYSASARIVTTVDQMLQQLDQIPAT